MKKYISFIAVVFAVGIAGCKKDYLSQEQNPNQPSITTPTLLLPAAEVKTAYIYQRAYPMYGVWDGYWTTSGNYVPNPSINEYQITTGDFGLADGYDIYTDLYLANANFNVLQGLSTGSENANYAAIAIIMKAFNFEQLVDNYNDVPYTQAFDPKNVTPAFDKGVDIYHDLGKQLDNAIKLIQDNPNATVPTTDVMFNGDMGQWAQFANTLKLRLAVMVYKKLGKTDPLVADLASTASVGYLSADAAINPGYTQALSGSGTSQESPFYGSYGFDVNGNATGNNNYYRANATAVNFYNDNNDPRASRFYAPITGGGIQGNVFGDILHNNANPKTSAIGPGLLKGADQGAVLISASESDFLQAEAINQSLIPASSTKFASDQEAYQQGITDSFTDLGLTAAQATTYYSQNADNVGWGPSPNKLTAILTQKWAAMNGWFNLVAYNDYRRTGIPNLPSSVDPTAIGTNLPTRILYPTSELSTNTANVGKEGTINPLTSKIFWAQ
jgi:hypothetical protein